MQWQSVLTPDAFLAVANGDAAIVVTHHPLAIQVVCLRVVGTCNLNAFYGICIYVFISKDNIVNIGGSGTAARLHSDSELASCIEWRIEGTRGGSISGNAFRGVAIAVGQCGP